VNYLHEIKEGAPVRVDARVLAHDAKRLHLYLELFAGGHDDAVSASEQMLLHVDTRDGAKSAPFDDDVAARVAELHALQRECAAPAYVGRVIGLPPRR
jgi:acyl-CoA thioester hydrolase